jgi:hypothetical protein
MIENNCMPELTNMLQKKVTLAEHTAYPELYSDTYWGGGRHRGTADEDQLCLNRNRFAEDFRLRKRWKTFKIPHILRQHRDATYTCGGSEMDHVEAYLTAAEEVILLVSNYNYPPPKVLWMPEYLMLYHPLAKCYVRRWRDKATFRRHITAAKTLASIGEFMDSCI